MDLYHVTGSQLIIYVLHKCGFACSTKEAEKFEINATCTDILDLEFNAMIGIQSSLLVGDNAVVPTENLSGNNTFHSTCPIFSAFFPEQLTQGSFGKANQPLKVWLRNYSSWSQWHKTIQEGEEYMVQYAIAWLVFMIKSFLATYTANILLE